MRKDNQNMIIVPGKEVIFLRDHPFIPFCAKGVPIRESYGSYYVDFGIIGKYWCDVSEIVHTGGRVRARIMSIVTGEGIITGIHPRLPRWCCVLFDRHTDEVIMDPEHLEPIGYSERG